MKETSTIAAQTSTLTSCHFCSKEH